MGLPVSRLKGCLMDGKHLMGCPMTCPMGWSVVSYISHETFHRMYGVLWAIPILWDISHAWNYYGSAMGHPMGHPICLLTSHGIAHAASHGMFDVP